MNRQQYLNQGYQINDDLEDTNKNLNNQLNNERFDYNKNISYDYRNIQKNNFYNDFAFGGNTGNKKNIRNKTKKF